MPFLHSTSKTEKSLHFHRKLCVLHQCSAWEACEWLITYWWICVNWFILSDLLMSIFLCCSEYSTDAQSPPLLRILEACIWSESLARTSCSTHSRCWRHRVRFPRLQVVMGGNAVICGYGVCWAAFCSCTKAPYVNTAARVRKSKLFGFYFIFLCMPKHEKMSISAELF